MFKPCDVLIVGAGIAGLTLALQLPKDLRVVLLSKDLLDCSASYQAQGGIASVQSHLDSHFSHIEDSLNAAAGLADLETVTLTIEEASASVKWLLGQGVEFNSEAGKLHLAREGGHSHARIAHVQDATGKFIISALQRQLNEFPNISLFTNYVAIDLVTVEGQCQGVEIYNTLDNSKQFISAKITVLATGGASGVFQNTTNLSMPMGDGIAMAWRAGCEITNMEFVQFHPTCLFDLHNTPFLITEAIRGHGGWLRTNSGLRFMPNYDPRAELATRDIVSRAIYSEMRQEQSSHANLDLTHLNGDEIKKEFPNIYEVCLQKNIDITQQWIPVAPAAHYTCGGVVTDLFARTSLSRVYAIGEVACTGLHGANRLASNSLLEGIVFAKRAALDIAANIHKYSHLSKAPALALSPKNNYDFQPLLNLLRQIMWEKVGIVRSHSLLSNAKTTIAMFKSEFNKLFSAVNESSLKYRNALDVCELIVEAALQRQESRGCHFREDYPFQNDRFAKNTVFVKRNVSDVA